MIGLVDYLLGDVKSVIFFGLDSCDLLADSFFTFLAISSFNGVPRDRIDNILHELPPFHHTVTINIDLRKKFVTTVNQLIFLVVILTINRIEHQLYEILVIDPVLKLVPVILKTLEPLFAHEEHDLLWQERKLHDLRLSCADFLLSLFQWHEVATLILVVVSFDFDGVHILLLIVLKERVIFIILILFVRSVFSCCINHVGVCTFDVKTLLIIICALTVIHFAPYNKLKDCL